MMRHLRRDRKRTKLARLAAAGGGLLLFALLLTLAFSGLGQVEAGGDAEGLRLLEDNLRRAALTCYAVEGFYPPSLDYLSDNYGLIVDKNRFAVHYSVFADNIMPEITVVPLLFPPQ